MTTFLLIHGAYQGGWIWKPVATKLRAEGHLVRAPSLDGCGERAAQMRPGITTESQAEGIAGLLYYEDLSEVVLVGTSAGGMVAAKAAALARERVKRPCVRRRPRADAWGEDSRHRRRTTALADQHRGGDWPVSRRHTDEPSLGPRAGVGCVGGGSIRDASDRGLQPTGRAGILLGPALGRLGYLVQAGAEPWRGTRTGRPPPRGGRAPSTCRWFCQIGGRAGVASGSR